MPTCTNMYIFHHVVVDLYQYNFKLIIRNCCYLLKKNKTLLYFVLPSLAFILILSNIFFGHLVSDSIYDQDINKYSIYVHLHEGWASNPGNILFDITNVWNNFTLDDDDAIHTEDPFDISTLQVYNTNQLQYQHDRSYVELKHEFSDCESSWKPVLYRYVVDTLRNKVALAQGTQLHDDPYISVFPTVKYKDPMATASSYAQFIPICTLRGDGSGGDTSYEYSISINDPNSWFDVYFVPSSKQLDNYLDSDGFYYYPQDGCHATGHQSFHGTCENVGQDSGLLVVIPDTLTQSLTKVQISLHETR